MANSINLTSESESQFFQELVPPESFNVKKMQMEEFTKRHCQLKNRVVLITSGGTTVPLESRTVRYIDNFSIGTRGATSAEYFLKHGYAVLFLHRHRSLQPFFQRVEKNILDVLSVSENDPTVITVSQSFAKNLAPVVNDYHRYKDGGMLSMVEFTTLTEYLILLRAASEAMQTCGRDGMVYLAAAVADFYVPRGLMPEHKIQSSEGALKLTLEMTPKMLKPLVKEWVPNAFVISFKLETDQTLLIEKSRKALQLYQHQMVIANILETRKKEVFIVTMDAEEILRLSDEELGAGREIEEPLIDRLVAHHTSLLLNYQLI